MDANSFRTVKRVLIALVLVNFVLALVGVSEYRNMIELLANMFGLGKYITYLFIASIVIFCIFNILFLWTVIVENNCLVAFFMVISVVDSIYEAFCTGAVLVNQNDPYRIILQIVVLFVTLTMAILLVAFFRALQAVRLNEVLQVEPQPNYPSSFDQFGSSTTYVVGYSPSRIASKV